MTFRAHTWGIGMSTAQDVEQAVERLDPTELAKFRAWFAAFDADAWDEQIEADAAAGRLDDLAAEALADSRADRCREC